LAVYDCRPAQIIDTTAFNLRLNSSLPVQLLSFKTAEIEARIRKASAEQAIRVSRKNKSEKSVANQEWRKQLIAKGGGDFWEAAGKYPAGPKGENFARCEPHLSSLRC
jgi:hypothetical protein